MTCLININICIIVVSVKLFVIMYNIIIIIIVTIAVRLEKKTFVVKDYILYLKGKLCVKVYNMKIIWYIFS